MAKRIVLSDGNKVNSRGYRIDLSGGDLSRFSVNPVMLYNHKDDRVIGRWENVSVINNRLEADPVFDEVDEVGGEVKRKYENDFLRAASIGLIVLDMQLINDVWTVTKWELLEASIVSIPADAGAVVLYNENKEVLTFEQLQLSFNNNNNQQQNQPNMQQIALSQRTVESLALPSDYTPKDVELAVAEKDKEIARLKAMQVELESGQQLSFLDQAEKDGKITAEEKVDYLELSKNGGFAKVQSLINKRTAKPSTTLADKVTKSNLSAGRETWDYLKWMKEDPKGLEKLKAENPTEFERLQTTFKNK